MMKSEKQSKSSYFDAKTIEQHLILENRFIVELCSGIPGLPIPVSEDFIEQEEIKTGNLFGSEKRATSLEELHKKLQELKGKKLEHKDRLFKKGIKNQIEKKRNARKKMKRILIKVNKDVSNVKHNTEQLSVPAEPVFNSEGHMVFNKFDFAENASLKPKSKKVKSTKNPRKLMKKLAEQEEKLKHLEEAGETEKILTLKEKQTWKNALQKAQGVKVKDNPKLLMKSLKRKEHQKRKSAKEWKKREDIVEQKKQERQRKRTANIEEKKRKKRVAKAKKLVKRGRIIPGFT